MNPDSGELWCRVGYNSDGSPEDIHVARGEYRVGEWGMDGSTAVYQPNNVLSLSKPSEEAVEYVRSLPFVQAVDMGDSDE